MRIHLLIGIAVAVSGENLLGCAISWKTPTNHFDSVNERGFLSYWEQIGTFDFGNGRQIPLILNFRSNRDSVSPYGGYGWMVGLLESHVVQLEENRFMLVQPDGWNRYFGRKNASETTLLGDGGWAAELKGNVFTSWADCGWKLVHVNGKISSMTTPDNRRFDWVRSGDRVTEIREGGAAKLTVKWNDAGTEMVGIESNGQKYAFERNDKPRVQFVADQNVVTAIDRSLSRVVLPDGSEKSYEFGVDEQVNPTFKPGGRVLTWNPDTKHILSDGDWKYQITPSQDGGYAAIDRGNGKNQGEFWHDDRNKGVEIIKDLDGVRKTTFRFPNGRLAGAIRKITEKFEGKTEVALQNSYDERGRLILTSTADGKSIRNDYHGDKRIESRYKGENLVRQMTYIGEQLEETRFEDGSIESHVYSGEIRTTTLADSKGNIVAIKKYDRGRLLESHLESRTEKYFYQNDTGRVDRIEWNNGTVFRFAYDSLGGQIAAYENTLPIWFQSMTESGQKVKIHYDKRGAVTKIEDVLTGASLPTTSALAMDPQLSRSDALNLLKEISN